MTDYVRGVVWPHGKINENSEYHRYVIVGMMISKEPVPELEGQDTFVLDGTSFNLLKEALISIPKREPTMPVGDANNVLGSLNYI